MPPAEDHFDSCSRMESEMSHHLWKRMIAGFFGAALGGIYGAMPGSDARPAGA